VRITIDHGLCEGNAVCEGLAPMVFDLDDEAQARVLPEAAEGAGRPDEVGEEHRVLVERAAESCPRLAITVSESS
jgi:ferredoxin